MSASDNNALRTFVDEMVLVLAPLVDAAQKSDELKRLLAELGWNAASVPQPLLRLATAGSSLIDAVGADPDELATPQLLTAIGGVIDAINVIHARPDSEFPDGVDIAAFKNTIGRDLLDYCVVEYLLRHRFKIGRLLKLAGIVQLIDTPAEGLRQTHLKRHVEWSRVGTLITDPITGFREAYGWTSAASQLPHVLSDIASVLEAYGLEFSYFRLSADQLAFANAGAVQPLDHELGICLDLDEALGVPPGSEAGVRFLVRAATIERGPAIAVLPFARLSTSSDAASADAVSLSIRGDADLTQGVAITLAPGREPTFEAGFLGGHVPTTPTQFEVQLRLPPAADAQERVLVGTRDGSRLSAHTFTISAGAARASGQQLEAFVQLALEKLCIVVKPAPDEADSFIASLLGNAGVSAELSLSVRLSSLSGFHLSGSGGLEGRFPVAIHLGPVDIRALSLALKPSGQGISFEVGAALTAGIGPVAIVADGVGFELVGSFPDPPTGNLGPMDVAFQFKPPSGIGLALEVPGVASGGGFLFHDAATSTYAGVMQVSIYGQLTVTAFGLISTRMPDGSRGYSLVVFITADDFRPIQLGLGFTLLGIGGMVGINRTFDENFLREGIKNNTLGTLLFPRDPVRNAPAIISSLAKAFPARSGSYLVGLLAKIGWFTPTLVLMQLAIIVEFGARKRLLVLGRVSSLLPSRDNDLVRINVDVVGVIDFDQGNVAVDGMLVDSRLAHAYALTGAMALRARWGSGPGSTFVLAVGGLHPRFAPPSDLPKLSRIAIAFSSGNNPRLTCEAYFAITANTVQFGARAQLYAAAYGFSIEGDIGYDVLVEIAPLHFIADFHAKVQLKHGSSNLFSVSVKGELEGPRPLRVSGKASFSIFWCDFSVRFDKTLVEGEKPPLPAAVDLLAQLRQALTDTTSWSVQTRSSHGVALRKLASGAGLVLDPLGTLVVKQQIVPLNTTRDIDRYGGAPVSGARRFHVDAALQSQGQHVDAIRGQFSPAQYFALSDDEKLAAPSFEEMDCGIMFGGDGASFDEAVPAPLIYDSLVFDTMPQPAERDPRYTMLVNQLMLHTKTGSVARAPIRNTGPARFRVPDAPKAAELVSPRFRIVPLSEGAPAPVDPGTKSWSEYRAPDRTASEIMCGLLETVKTIDA